MTFAANCSTVTKAHADSKGILHIITADGRDHTIRPKKWQSGFGDVQVAPDGKTVGWLVEHCSRLLKVARTIPMQLLWS
jgi:hypothetical protein